MEDVVLTRVDNCTKCKRCQYCETVCLIPEVKQADLMILVDTVNLESDKKGAVVYDKALLFLQKIVERAIGFPWKNVHVAFATKCYADREVTTAQLESCVPYLDNEIALVKPKCVLSLGGDLLKHFSEYSGIERNRGKSAYYKDIPIIFTYSHKYMLFNSENEKKLHEFALDIESACNIASGKDVDVVTGNKIDFTQHKVCTHYNDIIELVEYVKTTKVCSFDLETTGLEFWKDSILTISITFQHGSAWVIPLYHKDSPFNAETCKQILSILDSEIFNNYSIKKYGWNAKFDMKFLQANGVHFCGSIDDGMLMHHLLDENSKHGLKVVSAKIWTETAGYELSIKDFSSWGDIPLDMLCRYNALDTDLTLRSCNYLESVLIQDVELYRLYRNLVKPALLLLTDMEYKGMLIDRKRIIDSAEELKVIISDLELELRKNKHVVAFENAKRIRLENEELDRCRQVMSNLKETSVRYKKLQELADNIIAGNGNVSEPINFNSPLQLSELLYGKDGFNFPPMTETSKFGDDVEKFTTDKRYLYKLTDNSGFIDKFINYRQSQKILSTYLLGIHSKLDFNDYVHPEYLQVGTATGRLSCKNPNLQNCVSGDTEVLTTWGWTAIKFLAKNTPIAQWNTDNTISFVVPKHYIQNPPTNTLKFFGDNFSMECTYDHRCVFYDNVSGCYYVKHANNFDTGSYTVHAGYYSGAGGKYDLDFIKLVAIFINNGNYSKLDKVFRLTFVDNDINDSKIGSFIELLNSLGKVYKVSVKTRKRKVLRNTVDNIKAYTYKLYTETTIDVSITPKVLGLINRLKRDAGYLLQWLLKLSGDEIDTFLNSMVLWKNYGKDSATLKFNTKKLADVYQSIYSLRGVRTVIVRDGSSYFLDMNKDMYIKTDNVVFTEGYCDTYCVTVDTSYFLTRHKGIITVTGNCPRGSTPLGGRVKEVFTAPEGYTIVNLDYSQAELRIAAVLSQDLQMCKAYAEGLDLHQITAMSTSRISEQTWAEMTKDEKKELRTKAKAINFGFLYGMSSDSFKEYAQDSYGVKTTYKEAEKIRESFFRLYPGLLAWHRAYKDTVRKNGYVCTMFGRKRRLPDIYSESSKYRSDAERQAINSPVQGTAGEFAIFAACILKNRLPEKVHAVNTVHDSLVFYVPDDILDSTVKLIKETCKDPLTLQYFGFNLEPVGMGVDVEIGKNWRDLKEYKENNGE